MDEKKIDFFMLRTFIISAIIAGTIIVTSFWISQYNAKNTYCETLSDIITEDCYYELSYLTMCTSIIDNTN